MHKSEIWWLCVTVFESQSIFLLYFPLTNVESSILNNQVENRLTLNVCYSLIKVAGLMYWEYSFLYRFCSLPLPVLLIFIRQEDTVLAFFTPYHSYRKLLKWIFKVKSSFLSSSRFLLSDTKANIPEANGEGISALNWITLPFINYVEYFLKKAWLIQLMPYLLKLTT